MKSLCGEAGCRESRSLGRARRWFNARRGGGGQSAEGTGNREQGKVRRESGGDGRRERRGLSTCSFARRRPPPAPPGGRGVRKSRTLPLRPRTVPLFPLHSAMPYVLPILALLTLLAVWRAGYLRPAALAFVPRARGGVFAAGPVGGGGFAGVDDPAAGGRRGGAGAGSDGDERGAGVGLADRGGVVAGEGVADAGGAAEGGADTAAAGAGPAGGRRRAAGGGAADRGDAAARGRASDAGGPPPADHEPRHARDAAAGHPRLTNRGDRGVGGRGRAAAGGAVLPLGYCRRCCSTWWGGNAGGRVVAAAAAVFALVHAEVVSWHALPGLFVLGVVLGWVFERTGSLLPCVLIHAGFNALNLWAAWEMR